jgi:two-component system chemotaxis response regulator CheB
MRRLISGVFAELGDFELAIARDGVEALEKLHSFQPHVVTLDIHMPQMDGLACLDRIMVERPCPVIMVSSLTEAGANTTLEAMQLGAVDFIAKPFTIEARSRAQRAILPCSRPPPRAGRCLS